MHFLLTLSLSKATAKIRTKNEPAKYFYQGHVPYKIINKLRIFHTFKPLIHNIKDPPSPYQHRIMSVSTPFYDRPPAWLV